MKSKSNPQTDNADIFKTLFSNPSGNGSSISFLFENNPFKRKLEEENPPNLGLTSSSGKANAVGEESGGAGIEKKLKKRRGDEEEQGRERNLDVVGTENAEMEGLEIEEEKGDLELGEKKKKKRKRREIEEEYEARKYDVEAAEDEDEGMVKVGRKRKLKDRMKEVVPKKEDFDDDEKLRRTIFVGNLPVKLMKKTIIKEFTKFGEVESVRLRSVPILESKLPRKSAIIKGKINEAVESVHAYVVYKDEQSVAAALLHNMAKMGDHHIRVDRAIPPRKKQKAEDPSLYSHKRTLFVGNLPFDVKDEELYQLFCGTNAAESNVEAIRIIRDPQTHVGKGIGYVLFKSREAANTVVKKRHQYKIRDRELRLSHAQPPSLLPTKRANPSPASHSPHKRRDTTTSGSLPSGKSSNILPYQGLRAGASDRLKKSGLPRRRKKGMGDPVSSDVPEVKERKLKVTKRPAVAARKAMTNLPGGSLQKKRKNFDRTPDYSHKKKARR